MGTFLLSVPMTIKVLINALGQHLIADVKQVEDADTNEVLAYWLREPRLVSYQPNEAKDGISVRFLNTCTVAVTTEYSVRADHIVSILDPKDSVLEAYRDLVFPTLEDAAELSNEEEVTDEVAE